MTGGSLSATAYVGECVGYSGMGAFTQSGGTNSIGPYYGSLYLGYNPGSSGTYNLSGSGLLSPGISEYVGFSGTGSFTQSGGTNSLGNSNDLYLGGEAGGSGTYNLSGSGLLTVGYEFLGTFCTGAFTQTGGTNNLSGDLARLQWPVERHV